MRRRLTVLVTSALLLVAAPACRGSGAPGPPSTAVPYLQVDPASRSATDRDITSAQERLRKNLADDGARLDLANAFLQKAREVADPTLYTRAETLLKTLADRQAGDKRVLVARAVLALAQHAFKEALELADRAVAAAPGDLSALGVQVDAFTELGRVLSLIHI